MSQKILDTIGNAIGSAASSVNPYNETLNKERKKMIQTLIAAGYSKESIIKLLYVSEADAEKYIDKLYAKAIKDALSQKVAKGS